MNRAQLATWIPRHFTQTTIRLNNRNIASIDSQAFNGISLLTRLDIVNNQFTRVPLRTFDNLINLNILNINNNQLDTIDGGIFRNLNRLNILNLSNNQLTNIPTNTFDSLVNLNKLHLGSNQLNQIDPLLFRNLNSLTTLNLSNNQFSRIPQGLFSSNSLANLRNVYLRNNPISISRPNFVTQLCSTKPRCTVLV